jgi:hypothetical protein
MDRKIQNGSSQFPESQQSPTEQNIELWEPPFDRWLKLTDDLLRDWPHAGTNYQEHRF